MLGTLALTVGSLLRGTVKRRDGPSVRHKVVLGTLALTVGSVLRGTILNYGIFIGHYYDQLIQQPIQMTSFRIVLCRTILHFSATAPWSLHILHKQTPTCPAGTAHGLRMLNEIVLKNPTSIPQNFKKSHIYIYIHEYDYSPIRNILFKNHFMYENNSQNYASKKTYQVAICS